MRIEAYPDRLRVTNPGGLHGEISRTRLFSEPLTSSRNSHLARLLEDVEIPRTNRTVCENRRSGLLAVARELRKAGLEPPDLADRISATTMTIQTAGYDAQPPRQPHPTGATTEPGRPIRVRATDSMPPAQQPNPERASGSCWPTNLYQREHSRRRSAWLLRERSGNSERWRRPARWNSPSRHDEARSTAGASPTRQTPADATITVLPNRRAEHRRTQGCLPPTVTTGEVVPGWRGTESA